MVMRESLLLMRFTMAARSWWLSFGQRSTTTMALNTGVGELWIRSSYGCRADFGFHGVKNEVAEARRRAIFVSVWAEGFVNEAGFSVSATSRLYDDAARLRYLIAQRFAKGLEAAIRYPGLRVIAAGPVRPSAEDARKARLGDVF